MKEGIIIDTQFFYEKNPYTLIFLIEGNNLWNSKAEVYYTRGQYNANFGQKIYYERTLGFPKRPDKRYEASIRFESGLERTIVVDQSSLVFPIKIF